MKILWKNHSVSYWFFFSFPNRESNEDSLFTLKKWNAVAVWSWDVECDTCAICRVQVMDDCLRCQAESKADTNCVVVWGECNHR